MFTATPILKPNLKSIHQHRHLLLQFILAELIAATQEMQEFQFLFSYKSNRRDLAAIESAIKKLSGSSRRYMRLFGWNDDGNLTKLKNYCAHWCQSQEIQNDDNMDLEYYSNQAWLFGLQSLDFLRRLNADTKSEEMQHLIKLLQKTKNALKNLAKAVHIVLKDSKLDENVLFCLLRHHQAIDKIYKKGFVAQFFSNLFPGGLEAASSYLITSYGARGFNHLIPFIETQMATLYSGNKSRPLVAI